MDKFSVLKNESFNVGSIQKQRVVIKQNNNKPMKPKEIKKLVQMLEKKYIDNKRKCNIRLEIYIKELDREILN